MEFSLSAKGYLREPNLHDGFVDGIKLDGQHFVRVFLRDVTEQRYVMELAGVEGLIGNEFRQGNIIFDVKIVRGVAPDMEALRSLFEPPHPTAPAKYQDEYGSFLDKHAERIKNGDLSLVRVESSYGCSIISLCADIRITRG
ncbi:MAG: hypothetical protein JO128_12525 [Alphaproteobacteria bacterium]|nr:hypothetical protein [Alphaproteobacteria bacterium]